MGFLDQFSVLLLDMNGTFMFGQDRFGPDQDYYETYRRVGGHGRDREQVTRVVDATIDGLSKTYCTPERFDDFPTLAEVLLEYGGVEKTELATFEGVFAAHELGHVPVAHENFLRDTARSHELGVVSNIWSPPDRWLVAFRDSGLLALFKTIVFSSEGRSVKPSRLLFERAFAGLPPDSTILFVGDSLERDIIPAKALGLSTAWIAPTGCIASEADVVVDSLPRLTEIARGTPTG